MKNAYLPEAQNDRVFTFLGSLEKIPLIACGVALVAIITLVVSIIRKNRKGGK